MVLGIFEVAPSRSKLRHKKLNLHWLIMCHPSSSLAGWSIVVVGILLSQETMEAPHPIRTLFRIIVQYRPW